MNLSKNDTFVSLGLILGLNGKNRTFLRSRQSYLIKPNIDRKYLPSSSICCRMWVRWRMCNKIKLRLLCEEITRGSQKSACSSFHDCYRVFSCCGLLCCCCCNQNKIHDWDISLTMDQSSDTLKSRKSPWRNVDHQDPNNDQRSFLRDTLKSTKQTLLLLKRQ